MKCRKRRRFVDATVASSKKFLLRCSNWIVVRDSHCVELRTKKGKNGKSGKVGLLYTIALTGG